MKFSITTSLTIIVLIHKLKTNNISELCQEEKKLNFQETFNQPDLSSTLKSSDFIQDTDNTKIYQIDYNDPISKNTIKIDLEKIIIKPGNFANVISKEIAFMKEFSKTNPDRFMKIFSCFYSVNERRSYKDVYVMKEILFLNLSEQLGNFSAVGRLGRYRHYLNLIYNLRYFHKRMQRHFFPYQPLVKLNIKLENMRIVTDNKNKDTFVIKPIDFSRMEAEGTNITLDEMSVYIHPDFLKKAQIGKALADPKYDVYAALISIAILEYGVDFVKLEANCENDFTSECFENLRRNIYNGYSLKYKKKEGTNRELLKIVIEAEKEQNCIDLICLIFRGVREDIGDVGNVEAFYNNMKIIIERMENMNILI